MDPSEEQIRKHQDRVYGFAYYFLGSPEEAEDLGQALDLDPLKDLPDGDASDSNASDEGAPPTEP